MDTTRAAVWATVGVILVTVAVSGLLPNFPPPPDQRYCDASGNATVTVEDTAADELAIVPTDANQERYELTGPPIRATATDVRGCPVLVYRVGISDLGFTSVRRTFLSPEGPPSVSMSVVGGTFDGERITNGSYPATVELQLEGNETRTVYSRNVTVPVSE